MKRHLHAKPRATAFRFLSYVLAILLLMSSISPVLIGIRPAYADMVAPSTVLTTDPANPDSTGWFTTPPLITLSTGGGPTYYRWAGGSTYSYTRLPHQWTGGGTPLSIRGDDTGALYALPFAFSFYGVSHNNVYISSNGLLTFGGSDNAWWNSGSEMVNRVAIAPLWDDLRTDQRTGDDVYVYVTAGADWVGFRWQTVTYGGGSDTNFEAILYRDGRIQFNYGAQAGGLSPTIGISNGDGNYHTAYDNNLTTTNNMDSILYTPQESWRVYEAPFAAPEGVNTLYYYSVDEQGNEESMQSREFRVDTQPPGTPVIYDYTNPITPGNVTDAWISGSAEPGATVHVTVTDGVTQTPVAASAVADSGGYWYVAGLDLSGLDDGTIIYSVSANDEAGNVSDTSSVSTFKETVPRDSDYFVYGSLNTGLWGVYGVDGYVGRDGIDRIIFYSGTTAYIYTVTIPNGSDPNIHPSNPDAPGEAAPRTFTLERTFELGVWPDHESEFYVDIDNNAIYLGASLGIRKYVWSTGANNYIYDSTVAPPSPGDEGYGTQTLAYDAANDTWYAGAIAWNSSPGNTLRKMWKYAGSQGGNGTWQLAFEYTTPEGWDSMTHHDGMEFINGYLFLADYVGDYIKQYTTDGTLINTFWHEPLEHELEGMGHGALGHFWVGSHSGVITEFGGGRLQQQINNPPVVQANSPGVMVDEGQLVVNTGTIADPENDPVTLAASAGAVTDNDDGSWSWTFGAIDGPTQSDTVTITAGDTQDNTARTSFELTVNNVAPSVGEIDASSHVIAMGNAVTASANFTDPGILDTHTAAWDWGDGTVESGVINEENGSGSALGSHAYAAPGVYTIRLTITDKDGDSATSVSQQYVVIYDPSAGFVTGGGWINSPEGAYTADTNLAGRANFGFVSRYRKGATVPTGQTEFQFKVGDLNFHSTSYDWLVISGTKAQYKGSGTINTTGDYRFLLTATDDEVDRFRIKIWDNRTGTVMYDNQARAEDSAEPATILGGGSIVIHK